MSKPLVIRSYDEISSLIHRTAETVVIRNHVQPETEEAAAMDGQLELVSGITFHAFNEETGKLRVLQVQLKDLDENQQDTGNGGTFCTFGGTLETKDILIPGTVVSENEEVSYELTLEQFVEIIPAFAKKAAEEHLGRAVDVAITADQVVIFQTGKAANHPAKLVVSALIPVTEELMDELEVTESFNKDVIARVGAVGVDVGGILVSFDLGNVIETTVQTLIQAHGVDPLSATNVKLCTNNAVNKVLSSISYENIREAVKLRKAADELQAELTKVEGQGEEQAPATTEGEAVQA